MRNKKNFIMAVVCVLGIGLVACGSEPEAVSNKSKQTEDVSVGENHREQNKEQGDTQKQASVSETSKESKGEVTDAQLEEELKRYRQERENNIRKSNGLIEGGSPDEANYSFDMSKSFYQEQFDIRELTEGYAAARAYVTNTLGIEPDTKMATYMCIDPRILEIYTDDDKGVAAGYDNNNIFVCEYCNEDGVWQYLILVRDGKGSAWEVIYNGSSYKE